MIANRFRLSKYVLFAFAGVSLVIAGCEAQTKDSFEPIRLMVCQGKYQQAIPLLQKYQGKHASRASFFLGKAYLGMGDTQKALAAFEATAKRFSNTDEGHKSRYKIGMIHYVNGDLENAKRQFDELAKHPDGPLAAESQFMLQLFD